MTDGLTAEFSANDSLNVDISSNGEVDGSIETGGSVTEVIRYENDHSKLINRDEPGQHSIESITGLKDSLNDLEIEPLLNSDIEKLIFNNEV